MRTLGNSLKVAGIKMYNESIKDYDNAKLKTSLVRYYQYD